jgi:signal peptidase I
LATQRAHLARELVETLLLVGLIFVIVHFTVRAFGVQDSSMAPALQPSQSVLVNQQAYLIGGPGRGDVVVLVPPIARLKDPLVRRIVGLPGDTVSVSAQSIIVNGATLNEPFIQLPPGSAQNSTLNAPIKLGPDQYYVLADGRLGNDGTDSRTFGVVPKQNIIGRAVMVFWPLSQFHWIDTHSDDYSNVKNP